ncbi:DNA base-flipping protein [Anaerolineales bacterium]|nr:DNA base-flipping protein [Anaerolineales bacterium]
MSQIQFPPNPQAFNTLVWEIIRKIPRGKVASYGQIAKMLPPPAGVYSDTYLEFGALWVSGAVANSPEDIAWHRVVNSKGEISERDGLEAKRHQLLLEEEGVVFGVRGRIDMKKYGWNGKIKSKTS